MDLSEKAQRLGESPKISVPRSIKRDRSYRNQRILESGVRKESKRRRLSEPRSRSDTGRGRRRRREQSKSRSRQERRTERRANSEWDRGARRNERDRYPRRASRNRRNDTRLRPPYASPEHSLVRERRGERLEGTRRDWQRSTHEKRWDSQERPSAWDKRRSRG